MTMLERERRERKTWKNGSSNSPTGEPSGVCVCVCVYVRQREKVCVCVSNLAPSLLQGLPTRFLLLRSSLLYHRHHCRHHHRQVSVYPRKILYFTKTLTPSLIRAHSLTHTECRCLAKELIVHYGSGRHRSVRFDEKPLEIQNQFLRSIGFSDSRRLQLEGLSQDLGHLFRFVTGGVK